MSDVLRALREATSTRQSVLAERLPLAADDPGLAECARHLQLLMAWLAPMETWLAGFADGPQDPALLAPRQRTPLLAADLAHPLLRPWLAPAPGLAEDGALPTAAAPAAPWPAHADPAYRWGVLYAVEGTQLAGALLHRRVAQALAPLPLSYLMGSDLAADGGVVARWQAVMRGLNRAVRQRSAVAATCQGACDALDRLLGLMDEPGRATVGAAPAPTPSLGQLPVTTQDAAAC